MSSPSIFRKPAVRRARQELFMGKTRLASLAFSGQTFAFFMPMHRCAPDRDRDAIGVGGSLEGRIKMISTGYHAFESGHSTPLEARMPCSLVDGCACLRKSQRG